MQKAKCRMQNWLRRVREWMIRKLGGVPKRECEVRDLLIRGLRSELAAWQDMPAAARETRQIVPIRMQAKLYGFEEEGYFPEQALQEIHTAKREFMAREIGQAMMDKGLLKVRIQRNPFLQQVEMELHAEVLE